MSESEEVSSKFSEDLVPADLVSSDEESTEDKLVDLMKQDFAYPSPEEDDNFQEKIYRKREFYYHKIPNRPVFKNYTEIQNYRDKVCRPGVMELLPQQAFLANFINPDTPYKGILVMHGTGVGKTCGGIAIAERFKPMVQKYGTK